MRRMWLVLALLLAPAIATADAKRPEGPPTADDPAALIDSAARHEAKKEWPKAVALYQKLEQHRGYLGRALYLQARVAFQTGDLNTAEELARKALGRDIGPLRTDAKILYGDAIFRKGMPQRAKDIYIAIRNTVTEGAVKATLARKIIACNKQLRLAEQDGL